MKRSYSITLPDQRIAIADLSPPGECGEIGWWINRINVPDQWRGRGYGARLLRMMMLDADKESEVLALIPLASPGMRGLSEFDLEDWYKRHGFQWCVLRTEVIDGERITESEMRREPQ